jgi:hypothetical protein
MSQELAQAPNLDTHVVLLAVHVRPINLPTCHSRAHSKANNACRSHRQLNIHCACKTML